MARSRRSTSVRIGASRWPTFQLTATSSRGFWRWRLTSAIRPSGLVFSPQRDKSGAVVADRRTGVVTLDGARWTGRRPKGLVKPGDVFYVEPIAGHDGEYRLRQIPEVSGAASRWIPLRAVCSRWSADFRSTSSNSIERRRPSGSRVLRSSLSCMLRRSTTGTRRPRPFWTRRSRSMMAAVNCGLRQTSKARPAGITRCVSASSIRSI